MIACFVGFSGIVVIAIRLQMVGPEAKRVLFFGKMIIVRNLGISGGIIIIAIPSRFPSDDVSRENGWLRIVGGGGFVTSLSRFHKRYRVGVLY